MFLTFRILFPEAKYALTKTLAILNCMKDFVLIQYALIGNLQFFYLQRLLKKVLENYEGRSAPAGIHVIYIQTLFVRSFFYLFLHFIFSIILLFFNVYLSTLTELFSVYSASFLFCLLLVLYHGTDRYSLILGIDMQLIWWLKYLN